jgi:ABC-2 type transport system permease protein
MFWKIFLFEIQNRFRRPAVYLYFLAAFIFTVGAFATGSLPIGEKEHINAPYLIAMWCASITMLMMLISSSVMGQALYRDIEYQTKDYYLTYPITKAGYFWGRYFGSFFCMLVIASSIILGVYIGTKLGPAMGWKDPKEYGPNNFIYYLHPFLTIALPNLFFTSSLFFGLVAVTRNVKVIYSGGILLFLGYFLSFFFLSNTNNEKVILLADPFGLNGVRFLSNAANSLQKNNTLLPVSGDFLLNRLIWSGVGFIVILYTYIRFSFERFFSGARDKAAIDKDLSKVRRVIFRDVNVDFTGRYNRRTLWQLTKLELINIARDNYFWIILSSGMIFLAFVFSMGSGEYGVPNFPRTVMLFDIFNDVFTFFIFFIIIFYTGETLHRDRVTRYSFINDSLPPPNWVLNGSKLIPLLILGIFLTFAPVFVAMPVQMTKGFYHFNFPIYLVNIFVIILPRFLEMVIFSYVIHVVINNKFVAHGIGVSIWVLMFFLRGTGIFNYNLLLYSYTPWYGISDMDGLGHMTSSVMWFNVYWLLCGGLLIIVSALFYYRGITSSFKERLQLIRERFDGRTRLFTGSLLILFLVVGSYIYYNVSYLNDFLLKTENNDRAILYEKTLKRYEKLPLPKVTGTKMFVDLYPDKQQAFIKTFVTLRNKTNQPIEQMLVDADGLTDYSIRDAGNLVPYTCPLLYPRGIFNWFRPKFDTADFRLYNLRKPLASGDSLTFEVNSSYNQKGFSNGLFSGNVLRNGTFFGSGLPGLGYDEDDEIYSPYVRKKSGLPPKEDEEIAQNDPVGVRTLKAGKAADLMNFDVTISTSGDQTAIGPGDLQEQWKKDGRNYFHYVQNQPGLYNPTGIISARYAVRKDSVLLDHTVNINIFFDPDHNADIDRFLQAYKNGLPYYSSVYGSYPSKNINLIETPIYGPWETSMTTMGTRMENNSWNADFTDPNQFDYLYFNTTRLLAQQWWRFQVAPNSTIGSLVISEGLSTYDAIVMAEKKYGKDNMRRILQDQIWLYLIIRPRLENKEHPLIKANEWFEWGGKAGLVLYGLRDLIGEDSLNTALREFRNAYAFKTDPPFAGANNLYEYLQKHVPDSLQYYLSDTWQKITLYDNKVVEAKVTPTSNKEEYRVTIKVDVGKVWIDDKGNDVVAKSMNDYIDIGIFAADTKNKEGRSQVNPLYLGKHKFTAGLHIMNIIVKGKPVRVGIDPYAKLIDRQPIDNLKDL